jgi:hypothetical protein
MFKGIKFNKIILIRIFGFKETGLAWGDNGYAWIVIRNLFDMELNAFLANSTMFDKNYDE